MKLKLNILIVFIVIWLSLNNKIKAADNCGNEIKIPVSQSSNLQKAIEQSLVVPVIAYSSCDSCIAAGDMYEPYCIEICRNNSSEIDTNTINDTEIAQDTPILDRYIDKTVIDPITKEEILQKYCREIGGECLRQTSERDYERNSKKTIDCNNIYVCYTDTKIIYGPVDLKKDGENCDVASECASGYCEPSKVFWVFNGPKICTQPIASGEDFNFYSRECEGADLLCSKYDPQETDTVGWGKVSDYYCPNDETCYSKIYKTKQVQACSNFGGRCEANYSVIKHEKIEEGFCDNRGEICVKDRTPEEQKVAECRLKENLSEEQCRLKINGQGYIGENQSCTNTSECQSGYECKPTGFLSFIGIGENKCVWAETLTPTPTPTSISTLTPTPNKAITKDCSFYTSKSLCESNGCNWDFDSCFSSLATPKSIVATPSNSCIDVCMQSTDDISTCENECKVKSCDSCIAAGHMYEPYCLQLCSGLTSSLPVKKEFGESCTLNTDCKDGFCNPDTKKCGSKLAYETSLSTCTGCKAYYTQIGKTNEIVSRCANVCKQSICEANTGRCASVCDNTEYHHSTFSCSPNAGICCIKISDTAKLGNYESCMLESNGSLYQGNITTEEYCRYYEQYGKYPPSIPIGAPTSFNDQTTCLSYCDRNVLNKDANYCRDIFCKERVKLPTPIPTSKPSCSQLASALVCIGNGCDWAMNASGVWSCKDNSDSCERNCNIAGNEDWAVYTNCIATCLGATGNNTQSGCPTGTTYKSDWCTNQANCSASPRQGRENWQQTDRCAMAGDGICSGCFPPYYQGGGDNPAADDPSCSLPSNINIVPLTIGQEIKFDLTMSFPGAELKDGLLGSFNSLMPSETTQPACGKYPMWGCFDAITRINGVQTSCGHLRPETIIDGGNYKSFCKIENSKTTCTIPMIFKAYGDYDSCEIKFNIKNADGWGDCKKTLNINLGSVQTPPPTACNCSSLTSINPIASQAVKGNDKLTFSCESKSQSAYWANFRIMKNGSLVNGASASDKVLVVGKATWEYQIPSNVTTGKYIVQCQVCSQDKQTCSTWGKAINE